MSAAIEKRKPRTNRSGGLNRQVAQAKAVLRRLRDTLEELDDRRELARAKKQNAGRPGKSWQAVKSELGLE